MKRKAPSPAITTDEWLEELFRNPDQEDDGYLSVVEIAQRTNRSIAKVRQELQRAQQQERLLVKQRGTTAISGRKQWIPVYKVAQ